MSNALPITSRINKRNSALEVSATATAARRRSDVRGRMLVVRDRPVRLPDRLASGSRQGVWSGFAVRRLTR